MKTKEGYSSYEIISLITKFKSSTLLKMLYESKKNFKFNYTGYYIIAKPEGLMLVSEYNINFAYFIKYQNIDKIYIILSKDYYDISSNKDFIKSLKFMDIIFFVDNKKYTFSLKNNLMYMDINLQLMNKSSMFKFLNTKLNENQIKYVKIYNN